MTTRIQDRIAALGGGMTSKEATSKEVWNRVLPLLTDADIDRLEAMPELEGHGLEPTVPVTAARRDATGQIIVMLKSAAARISGSDDEGAAACLALAADLEAQLT